MDKIHPNHYKSLPLNAGIAAGESFDVIDIVHGFRLGFLAGNAVKYICRAGRKEGEDVTSDLRKAVECLRREIEDIESREGDTYVDHV